MNNGTEEIDPRSTAGGVEDSAPQDPVLDAELERKLRQALQRTDPPAGFVDAVMARVGASSSSEAIVAPPVPESAAQTTPLEAVQGVGRTPVAGKLLPWPVRRLWVGGAIAAALILGSFEGESAWQRVREQQRRVAAATAQFQTTERVTVHALAQAKEQLQRAGVPLTLD